jgi:hypothetical protein
MSYNNNDVSNNITNVNKDIIKSKRGRKKKCINNDLSNNNILNINNDLSYNDTLNNNNNDLSNNINNINNDVIKSKKERKKKCINNDLSNNIIFNDDLTKLIINKLNDIKEQKKILRQQFKHNITCIKENKKLEKEKIRLERIKLNKEDKEKKKIDKININIKSCTICKEDKDINNFHKYSRILDGYASVCKNCKITINKKNYLKYKKNNIDDDNNVNNNDNNKSCYLTS